jgi:hypothetical protein
MAIFQSFNHRICKITITVAYCIRFYFFIMAIEKSL